MKAATLRQNKGHSVVTPTCHLGTEHLVGKCSWPLNFYLIVMKGLPRTERPVITQSDGNGMNLGQGWVSVSARAGGEKP